MSGSTAPASSGTKLDAIGVGCAAAAGDDRDGGVFRRPRLRRVVGEPRGVEQRLRQRGAASSGVAHPPPVANPPVFAHPTTAPQAAPPPPTVDCHPPFYFDNAGNKVFKKECL